MLYLDTVIHESAFLFFNLLMHLLIKTVFMVGALANNNTKISKELSIFLTCSTAYLNTSSPRATVIKFIWSVYQVKF